MKLFPSVVCFILGHKWYQSFAGYTHCFCICERCGVRTPLDSPAGLTGLTIQEVATELLKYPEKKFRLRRWNEGVYVCNVNGDLFYYDVAIGYATSIRWSLATLSAADWEEC